jgi:hypothetical protein
MPARKATWLLTRGVEREYVVDRPSRLDEQGPLLGVGYRLGEEGECFPEIMNSVGADRFWRVL